MSLEKVVTEDITIEENGTTFNAIKRTVYVPKLVKARENWPKFGIAITRMLQDSTEPINIKPELGTEIFVRFIDTGKTTRVEKSQEELDLEHLKRQRHLTIQNLNSPLETSSSASGIFVPKRDVTYTSQEEFSKNNIKISNLGTDVDEYILEEIFKSFGRIQKVHILRSHSINELGEKIRGESRGIAFITFVDEDSALKAVQSMHGKIVDHNVIDVELSKSKNY